MEATSAAGPHATSLIGRAREQAMIDELLDGARQGQSGCLVLRGEPGVGKTSLLDHAAARAADFRVLRALGAEAESDLAFSGLLELLRPVANRFADLPESQSQALEAAFGGSGEADRFAVFAAALGVVALVAEDAPLLCVVDDAQWIDPASGEALLFVTRRLSAEGVVVLYGARDGEATYFEARGLPDWTVAGLDRTDAAELIRAASRYPLAPSVVARLAEATGGNPLALVEVPAGLREAQRLGAEPLDDPLMGGAVVERAFGTRVGALSDRAQRALLIAAVSDTDEMTVILQAAGDAADGLDEADAARLIMVAGDRLRFRHPLVRSAIYSRATGGERRVAHAALADALASYDRDRAVSHRALATSGYDDVVATALVEAAERARRRGGTESQANLLERAARLTLDPERRAEVLRAAGDAAYHAGRPESAASLLDEALALALDPRNRADIVNARTYVARAQGEIVAWLKASRDEADRIAEIDPPRGVLLIAQVWDYAVEQFDLDAARVLLDRMVELSGGPDCDRRTVGARAWQEMVENNAIEARAAAERGVALEAQDTVETTIELAFVFVYLGDCDAARALLEPLIERSRHEASLFDLIKAFIALGELEVRAGRLAHAEAATAEASLLASENGLVFWECGALSVRAVAEALLGRFDACARHTLRVLEVAPRVGLISSVTDAWYAIGISALTRGEIDPAIDAFEHCRDALGASTAVFFTYELDLIEAYLRAGRRADAQELLDAFEREAIRSRHDLAPMQIARARALLAGEGDADDLFQTALGLCDRTRWPLEHARIQLARGEQLRRVRSRALARIALRAALDLFEHCGAEGFAERARHELRATGEIVREAGDDRGRLTAQELQVAMLVARGATNREAAAGMFLSTKTIERHLSSIYRKLGVRSRSELARQLADW